MRSIWIIVFISLVISLSSLLISLYRKEILTDMFETLKNFPKLSTVDYSKVERIEVSFLPPSIILYSNCYKLVGYVEDVQARSISNALQGIRDFRPNTHDVTSDIFREFEIKLIDVRIEEVKNNTYIAKAFIMQGNKIREVDIRPSDGIALAIRLNSPIYIRKSLLERGEKIC